ncbi:hypothetical protein MMC34_003459 [Xylographa carneopallida]|nr:hypothetical protein [Xylographa carneopallida]
MVFAAFCSARSDEQPRPERRRRNFRSSSSSTSIPKTVRSASTELSTALAYAGDVFTQAPDKLANLADLNNALLALAAIFPDVRPEVFREMLGTFSGASRLHIVAEQLIKHKAKWVNGRWRVHGMDRDSDVPHSNSEIRRLIGDTGDGRDRILVPTHELFRSESYKQAVRTGLYQEFKALSRSTVDGVLAEQNHSYTSSRPILLGLASKSWKSSFSTFLLKWRKPAQDASDKHFMLIWTTTAERGPVPIPSLRDSGNKELDAELYRTILKPLHEKRQQAQEAINIELATLLNEQEAEEAGALYECECCFTDTTFEHMAICTTGTHIICFNCIQHAVSEALYGQSWGLNIDHTRSQIACLAPTGSIPCIGCIPHGLARRAILYSSKGGAQMWEKLESRLADQALLKSEVSLVRCPFCNYAEADELYLQTSPHWRLNTSRPVRTLLLLAVSFNFLGLLCLYAILARLFALPAPSALVTQSCNKLTRKAYLSARFKCRSQSCLRTSCLQCHKAWQDPHVCHESATLSLRTTVEAARTAALKRTCPRCGLGFVKDSGCNKMVCVCGYTMCYICRQGLGSKISARQNVFRQPADEMNIILRAQAQQGDGDGEGEGYRHFCQHFRPAGGTCGECEKCDLYRAENEDEIVRRAGERAEKDWRDREGLGKEVIAIGGTPSRQLGLQECVDWWVGMILKC